MKIIVLGAGCAKCKMVEQLTRKVVADLHLDAEVIKEEDITKIISYGVQRTPALIVDGEIALNGRVPTENELRELLTSKG